LLIGDWLLIADWRLVIGAPLTDVSAQDFSREGVVYQIGVPPGRIDILTTLTAISFAEAWPGRMRRPFGDIDVVIVD
jgi:hypothetical protein